MYKTTLNKKSKARKKDDKREAREYTKFQEEQKKALKLLVYSARQTLLLRTNTNTTEMRLACNQTR